MKQTIKHFFTKKRCKKLKVLNNKGFSLLEVLVAVSIIGIISAIAIPSFNDYRENASLTAVNTTASNIEKAYNLCKATRTNCNTLTALKINCDICGSVTEVTHADGGVCVDMRQKVGGQDFKACVHIKSNGIVSKTYGGDFKICHETCTSVGTARCTGQSAAGVKELAYPTITKCTENSDCSLSANTGSGGNTLTYSNKKCKARSSGGTCAASSGCS